jgi:cytochrome bd ubiquinol oxidase subunit I
MLPAASVVEMSRWQFGLTASYHFLFVPLTLGLSWILLIMETVYLITRKEIYKDMVRFWGKLFGINFAMAVITGLTLEFQFGQNWAFFSQYIGDVFGVPLAIEGMTAFMLESALFGVFFFGWNKVSPTAHWFATLALAVGSSLSALVILVANGWMQHPVGAHFDFVTMRMELNNWHALWFNSDAQVRFVHTIAAGYVVGATFVLSVSSYYLLKKRDVAFAMRSFAIAAGFGLASVLSVLVLGDANGLEVNQVQPSKMAAMEGVWSTPKAPAAWNLFAIPDQKTHKNYFDVKIPWALSLIATHSLSGTVVGMKQIIAHHIQLIHSGLIAYEALLKIRAGDKSAPILKAFKDHEKSLGYALLLKGHIADITKASPELIDKVARADIPNVLTLFWSFRIMVGVGIILLFNFLTAVILCAKRTIWKKRKLLYFYLWSLPLPWFATTAGWFIAEHGRQPWIVYGILPTSMGASTLASSEVWVSLIGLMIFFTGLLVVDLVLMFKYARLGPSTLHTGRYHFEKQEAGHA